mmetsp:Transcript_169/g.533  ORF Transcript_169/g.533 Transcript_169/m.533 type:complete len:204 (-) Transcript_169:1546-2157(-)
MSGSLAKKNSGKSPRLGVTKTITKSSQKDDVSTPNGNNQMRTRVKEMLLKAIYREDEKVVDGKDAAEDVVKQIEEAMFVKFNGTGQEYKDKFRTMNFNLKDEKNGRLRSLVLGGAIDADRLLSMDSQELANPERKEENNQIEKNLMREAQVFNPSKHAATSDFFKCGKCKQRKCTYYQMQTRSADEPLTSFVTCMVCNNRWKC